MTARLVVADCLDALREMNDSSIDAVVCDPPYGLEFMGKEWDSPWKDGKPSREFNQIEDGTLGGFTSLPNHSRVNNLRCEACGLWKFSSNPCKCAKPRFPNARLSAMVAFQEWAEVWATELLRVLKPGGHLLAFGGTRTYHRLACAIEDAGFEIRDSIHWVYGSGFPKSLDVSKAIDKAAGAERTVAIGPSYKVPNAAAVNPHFIQIAEQRDGGLPQSIDYAPTAPATDDAARWQGWGTALKPAHEPIVVARKPLAGTVAQTVLAHGTGALNIDGCRVGTAEQRTINNYGVSPRSMGNLAGISQVGEQYESRTTTEGRWPPNFLLTHAEGCEETCVEGCPVREMDAQGGIQKSGVAVNRNRSERKPSAVPITSSRVIPVDVGYGDTGGASRFFPAFRYQAKASRRERNAGLEGMPERNRNDQSAWVRECNVCGDRFTDAATGKPSCGHDDFRFTTPSPTKNIHPTVKPVELMRWLCRLVTPPGGVVLDPFTGSGTTGVAAVLEGFDFIGIEREPEYAEIAERRIAHAEARLDDEMPKLFDEGTA